MNTNNNEISRDYAKIEITVPLLNSQDLELYKQLLRIDSGVKAFGMSPSGIENELGLLKASGSVPTEIKSLIGRIRKLFLYSLLEYDFLDLAAQQCFLTIEAALRIILKEDVEKILNERSKKWIGLWELIKIASKKGFIPVRYNQIKLDAMKDLRNSYSHPTYQSIIPPAIAFESYYVMIDFINCLFDEEWRKTEPEVVKRLEDSRNEIRKQIEDFINKTPKD
jgi:hypothetical protein